MSIIFSGCHDSCNNTSDNEIRLTTVYRVCKPMHMLISGKASYVALSVKTITHYIHPYINMYLNIIFIICSKKYINSVHST